MIALSDYLILAAILFGLSVAGIFLNRKNVIILLMAIELMLLAVNMNFIAFSYFMDDIAGQVFVFFILTVAAADTASVQLARSRDRAAGLCTRRSSSTPTRRSCSPPSTRRSAAAARPSRTERWTWRASSSAKGGPPSSRGWLC